MLAVAAVAAGTRVAIVAAYRRSSSMQRAGCCCKRQACGSVAAQRQWQVGKVAPLVLRRAFIDALPRTQRQQVGC